MYVYMPATVWEARGQCLGGHKLPRLWMVYTYAGGLPCLGHRLTRTLCLVRTGLNFKLTGFSFKMTNCIFRSSSWKSRILSSDRERYLNTAYVPLHILRGPQVSVFGHRGGAVSQLQGVTWPAKWDQEGWSTGIWFVDYITTSLREYLVLSYIDSFQKRWGS